MRIVSPDSPPFRVTLIPRRAGIIGVGGDMVTMHAARSYRTPYSGQRGTAWHAGIFPLPLDIFSITD